METYVLFVINECGFCSQAIELLNKELKEYKVVDITNDLNARAQIKIAFDWPTFPLIMTKKERTLHLIGGYTDLKKEIEQIAAG